jgi:hypothetical protein
MKKDDESGRNTTRTRVKPAQERALAALLAGETVTKAAEAAGVSRQTCSEWIHKDAVFAAALEEARSEAWATARAKLESARGKAIDVLVGLLDEKPWSARLAAANALLALLKDVPKPERRTPEEIAEDRENAQMRAKGSRSNDRLLASLASGGFGP